jgi:hypothetical protein
VVIIGSAIICHAVPVHFDSVLTANFADPGPMWLFVAEGFSAWLCMALTLHLFGAILAPSRFRFVDMLGTQALARWPFLLVAVACLPKSLLRTMTYLAEERVQTAHTVAVTTGDVAVTIFALAVILAATIWTVMLMYKGYAVSTGIKQIRTRIISFIVALMIAEVVCKVVFIVMAVKAGVLPATGQQ